MKMNPPPNLAHYFALHSEMGQVVSQSRNYGTPAPLVETTECIDGLVDSNRPKCEFQNQTLVFQFFGVAKLNFDSDNPHSLFSPKALPKHNSVQTVHEKQKVFW